MSHFSFIDRHISKMKPLERQKRSLGRFLIPLILAGLNPNDGRAKDPLAEDSPKAEDRIVIQDKMKKLPDHPFLRALVSTYNTNPTLEAKAKEQYQRAEKVNQALAGWRPSVNFRGSIANQYNDNQASNAQNRKATFYTAPKVANVEVSQSIFAGGQTVYQTKQADKNVLAGMADFTATEQRVLLDSVTAYLNLWLRRSILSLRDKDVMLKETNLEQALARQKVGASSSTEVAQAESELAFSKANRITALAEMQAAEAAYIRAVGEVPGELPPPRELITQYAIPKDMDSYIKACLTNNPTILNASYTAQSSKAGIKTARAAFSPKVDLEARGQQSVQQGNADSRSRNGSVLLSLTIPIYQRGTEYSGYREASSKYKQDKVSIAVARRTVRNDAVQAWHNWKAALLRIDENKRRIEAQQAALDSIRSEYEVGEKTLRDVLDEENKLLEAQTNLVNAEQTYFLSIYQVLSGLGMLTAEYLALPVEPYALKAHYLHVRNKLFGLSSDIDGRM